MTITVEVVGGDHGPVELDSDGIAVLRIKNRTQKVRFVASKDGCSTVTKVLTLTGLTLAAS